MAVIESRVNMRPVSSSGSPVNISPARMLGMLATEFGRTQAKILIRGRSDSCTIVHHVPLNPRPRHASDANVDHLKQAVEHPVLST